MLTAIAMIASLSILAATPAAEPATEVAGTEAARGAGTDTAKKDKPKKICRTIRNTGMRTAARQCKTETQWLAEQERSVDGLELEAKSD